MAISIVLKYIFQGSSEMKKNNYKNYNRQSEKKIFLSKLPPKTNKRPREAIAAYTPKTERALFAVIISTAKPHTAE